MTDSLCCICGIATRTLIGGQVIHAEPRSLDNNLHNGTPDHNAVLDTPAESR